MRPTDGSGRGCNAVPFLVYLEASAVARGASVRLCPFLVFGSHREQRARLQGFARGSIM